MLIMYKHRRLIVSVIAGLLALLLVGGLLMVIGSGASIFMQSWAPYIFAPGALLFAAMQMRQTYDGRNFTVRRLRRIMLTSDVLFLFRRNPPENRIFPAGFGNLRICGQFPGIDGAVPVQQSRTPRYP